jgi:anti-sigma regulatory factor (Ser/Thr protein kinase)
VSDRGSAGPPDSEPPSARARRLVRNACRSWPDDRVEDAELLVTELIANAVQHANGPVDLNIAGGPNLLRVEVTDTNPQHPSLINQPRIDDEGGRGLCLVSTIADAWGSESIGQGLNPGKTVWFELRHDTTM